MKNNNPMHPKIIFANILISTLVLVPSCKKAQSSEEKSKAKVIKKTTPKSSEFSASSTLRAEQLSQREKLKNIGDLVDEKGVESLSYLYYANEGSARDFALTEALARLAGYTDKSTLLSAIATLPSGLNKQKWIWKAIEKGQGDFDEKLAKAISSLSYLEEKQTAINAYAASAKISTAADYERALSLFKSSEDLGKQFLNGMIDNLIRKYSAALVQQGPNIAYDGVKNLEKDQQLIAVGLIAQAMSSKNEVDALLFASNVSLASPDNAKSAYSAIFEQLGRTRPSLAESSLSNVPKEYRGVAVSKLVEGWIAQDSKAASQWAAGRSGLDLIAASGAIVQYLENQGAPPAEIEPWRAHALQR